MTHHTTHLIIDHILCDTLYNPKRIAKNEFSFCKCNRFIIIAVIYTCVCVHISFGKRQRSLVRCERLQIVVYTFLKKLF